MILTKIVQCKREDVDLRVDNYSGSTDKIFQYLKTIGYKNINLKSFQDFLRQHCPLLSVRLNLEVFSALVIRINNLTLLLYSSGKVSTSHYFKRQCKIILALRFALWVDGLLKASSDLYYGCGQYCRLPPLLLSGRLFLHLYFVWNC